jgi:hypothetical protein
VENKTIVLNESDKIVNNQKEVANHFNNKICIQNSTLSCEETIKLLGIDEVLFPALSLIFLNFYWHKNAKPKGRS